MSGRHDLKFEPELRKFAADVAATAYPYRIVPRRRWRWRSPFTTSFATSRPLARRNAAALAIRVFDPTMLTIPPASRGAQVACKAGCTYCCHNVVMATAPEIFLAVGELARAHDAGFIAGVAGRCDAVAATAGMRRNPCPLLHDNLCSVYTARPSVCRKHSSFSVDACIGDYEGRGGNIPIRRFDQEIFECCAVALLVGMRLWDGRQGSVFELSGALRVVLDDPGAEQRGSPASPCSPASRASPSSPASTSTPPSCGAGLWPVSP